MYQLWKTITYFGFSDFWQTRVLEWGWDLCEREIYNHRARRQFWVVNFLRFTDEDLKLQLKDFLSVSKLASGV